MKPQLKEVKQQGTPLHPMQLYQMQADAGRIDVPIHWQDTVEILLVQRGRLALRIGEAQFAGQPGDVFYINPRQLHGMQTPGPESAYLAFVFPPGWLRFAHSDEAAEQYLNPLAEGSAQVENRLSPGAASPAYGGLGEAPTPAVCYSLRSRRCKGSPPRPLPGRREKGAGGRGCHSRQ